MDLYKNYEYKFRLSEGTPLKAVINLKQLVFEVTSNCNLRCKYCGYGELYNQNRFSEGTNMNFNIAKNMIDYLFELWNKNELDYDHRQTFIAFYGGEPLLRMFIIKDIIEYLESLPTPKRRSFVYSMTTNGVLLDKHMDYLVEKKFSLLISLDGDEYAQSYRIDSDGKNSFGKVFHNIQKLRKKYPDYFSNNVNFNSVLTDRSNTFDVSNFIYENFGKYPSVAEVNESDILPSKEKEFKSIFHSLLLDWRSPSHQEIKEKLIDTSPVCKSIYNILKMLCGNTFISYNSLLAKQGGALFPTATCLPFDRKLFLTVGGDILPCERINQSFSLGKVTEKGVNINYKEIAEKYSVYYEKIWKMCRTCYAKPVCSQCLFRIHNIENKPVCESHMNKKQYDEYIESRFTYLSEHPDIYQKMMKEYF